MDSVLETEREIGKTERKTKCPVCEGRSLVVFFEVPSVPVNSISLWPSRDEALKCLAGSVELAFCSDCGAICNQAFDPEVLTYDSRYDNSLHFSPSFQKYAEELADRLIARFDLHGKDVVDVGCGKGDFLALLCARGGNRGLGFDPTYEQDRIDTTVGRGFRVVRDFYSQVYTDASADFLCCRHVLEHVACPRAFLADIRRAISHRTACGVFFEVPNALFTLRGGGIWDIIYEHCFYYTAAAIRQLFESCGFEVLNTYESFEGQYLCLEAKPTTSAIVTGRQQAGEVAAVAESVRTFARQYEQRLAGWRHILSEARQQAKGVVLWGAGAKGTTFLNALRDVSSIEYIVDLNPHKHGRFVPGTGQQVVAPGFLKSYRPDLVVITNPNYEFEIKRAVGDLGFSPEFRLV